MSDIEPKRVRAGNGETAAMLALVLSILSGIVSISSFGFGLAIAARGSDVHLFPFQTATFYRVPFISRTGEPDPERDLLGVVVRAEFANTAGPDYPDSLVSQRMEIDVDGAHFACFADHGDIRVFEPSLQAGPEARATQAAAALRSDMCAENSCRQLADHTVLAVADDVPLRLTLRPGEITSTERFFDGRAVAHTHACYRIVAERNLQRNPSPSALMRDVPDRSNQEWSRLITVTYHAETLNDGAFTAACAIRATAGQLLKFSEDGQATFPCEEAPEPRHDPSGLWDTLMARLGLD